MKPIISTNSRIRHPEHLVIGENSIIDDYCYFSTKVRIGRCTHIASGCSIAGGAEMQFQIGDFCSLSSGVKVWCTSDDFVNDLVTIIPPEVEQVKTHLIRGDVTLADYTAVGSNSVIMPNNHVLEGTVIGALSFVPVAYEFRPWSVYAGVPIRFVRPRNQESVMEQVQKLEVQLEARGEPAVSGKEEMQLDEPNSTSVAEGVVRREIVTESDSDALQVAISRQVTLSILLPVRNEGINLRIMVKLLKAVLEIPHELLIVYDFPEDDSIGVIRDMQKHWTNLRLVHNQRGRGVVNAIHAGVEAATGDYVLLFAADEVGPVLAIEDMLALMQEGCDIVSCSRYAHGGRRLGGSMIGGMLSRLANRLFHGMAGCVFSDATTGIKLFRRSLFSTLHLEANPIGWAVTFEIAMKAQYAGWRLGEVPVISIDRLYGGKSTFRLGPWTGEYLRWFFWGCRNLRKIPKRDRPTVRVRAASAFPSTGKG